MIQISAFWTIVLVVVIYTGIQHLLNWGFREAWKEADGGPLVPLIVAAGVATGACIGLIYAILQNTL